MFHDLSPCASALSTALSLPLPLLEPSFLSLPGPLLCIAQARSGVTCPCSFPCSTLSVVQNCHLCLLVISLSSQNVSCTRGGGGARFVCLVTDVSPAPRTHQAPSSTSANVLIHWMKEQMNVHRTKKYLYGATVGLL